MTLLKQLVHDYEVAIESGSEGLERHSDEYDQRTPIEKELIFLLQKDRKSVPL